MLGEYPQLIVGIDIGASGGIALLGTDSSMYLGTPGSRFLQTHKMPETEDDLADLLRDLPILIAYVEQIQYGGNPKDGDKRGMSSSINFGISFGVIKGVLAALKIKREFVHPQRWQAAMGIPKRQGKTKTEHKNVTKARAQQLFPTLKVTHAIADALLIAEYGRRLGSPRM